MESIGVDESHTIHQLRATTVILEEDGSLEDATTVNIVLPNRPHASALQVEEIGSYKLESHEQSVSYQVLDDGKNIFNRGIIDEIDSDTDPLAAHTRTKVTTSRNISINSVSEDEVPYTGSTITRELYVDEEKKNIELDDGFAEIKVKRIVLQEEEVITAEIHAADENVFHVVDALKGACKNLTDENDKKRLCATIANVESADEVDHDAGIQNPKIDRQSSIGNDKTRKGTQYDIEEKNENADLTPEEAKQLRIKEIRAKARRASLLNKEGKTDSNVLADDANATARKASISDAAKNDQNEPQTGKLLDKGDKVDEADIEPAKQANEKSIETTDKLLNGVEEEPEDEKDSYLENLLRNARRQRSVLEDIIERRTTDLDESTPAEKIVAEVADAEPVNINEAKQPLQTKSDDSQTATGTQIFSIEFSIINSTNGVMRIKYSYIVVDSVINDRAH